MARIMAGEGDAGRGRQVQFKALSRKDTVTTHRPLTKALHPTQPLAAEIDQRLKHALPRACWGTGGLEMLCVMYLESSDRPSLRPACVVSFAGISRRQG
jgi:hypothetical protein